MHFLRIPAAFLNDYRFQTHVCQLFIVVFFKKFKENLTNMENSKWLVILTKYNIFYTKLLSYPLISFIIYTINFIYTLQPIQVEKELILLLSSKITINNAFGLHVRPAAILSARAQKFQSEILFLYSYHIINAKSLMNILSACIRSGSEITIQCTGPDEEQALQIMQDAIRHDLNVAHPLHFNPASRPPHILDTVSYRKKSSL